VLFSYARSRVADPSRYAVVTDPGTPLGREAGELGIRHVFENSPTSAAVFVLSSSARSRSIDGLRRGELCERALDTDREEAVSLGEEMGAAALSGRDKTTIVVGDQTRSFGCGSSSSSPSPQASRAAAAYRADDRAGARRRPARHRVSIRGPGVSNEFFVSSSPSRSPGTPFRSIPSTSPMLPIEGEH